MAPGQALRASVWRDDALPTSSGGERRPEGAPRVSFRAPTLPLCILPVSLGRAIIGPSRPVVPDEGRRTRLVEMAPGGPPSSSGLPSSWGAHSGPLASSRSCRSRGPARTARWRCGPPRRAGSLAASRSRPLHGRRFSSHVFWEVRCDGVGVVRALFGCDDCAVASAPPDSRTPTRRVVFEPAIPERRRFAAFGRVCVATQNPRDRVGLKP